MKNILLLLSMILFAAATAYSGTYSGGDGTSGDPYQIATTADIIELSNTSADWSAYFIQTADIAFNADETQVDWDGDGSPDGSGTSGFSPIGNSSTNFTGSYNGQNHTIENLYINRPTSAYVGLFGYIDGTIIENLGATNVNITGQSKVGGLVGRSFNSQITGCYTTGVVNSENDDWNTGGLVGWNTNSSSISECYSTCNVYGDENTGGLVGENKESSTISSSYSTGNIESSTSNSDWGGAGGFAGGNAESGTIINCYSSGSVTRKSSSSSVNFGSFLGINKANVENSYSIGNVFQSDGETSLGTDNGFVGTDNSGSYTANFFDSEASNQSTATGATAKSTSEMKTLSTFTDAGWDFVGETANGTDDYWDMDYSENINNGYPYLSWEDGGDQSLPVELTSFTARAGDGQVTLCWVTESEINNDAFLLERSTDGESLELLAEIEGHGTVSFRNEYEYVDYQVENWKTYHYRLADRDYNGVLTRHKTITATPNVDGVQKVSEAVIKEYALFPAYPNPFNPQTSIRFNIPNIDNAADEIRLTVYNALGQKIATLYDGPIAGGAFEMQWNGRDDLGVQQPSGVYLVHFRSEQFIQTQKIVLVR